MLKKFLQRVGLTCNSSSMAERRAFTMVELLVVLAIASLFSFLVFRFYFQAGRSQTTLVDNLQMQSSVVTGVNKILREIRNGSEFVFPRLNEKSPVLIFSDFENNFVSLYPLLNKNLTQKEGENIYDIFAYTAETKTFNIGAPVHNDENLQLMCSNVRDISFNLANANSVTITVTFKKGGKTFQTISEGPLMNSGDVQ
ncbi:MAG: prepilin-type N-terminal cleavage/methylation domain-containing protein [Erysipelotrichia bacterium]|nr:prepilin-type N-terminal cleavage/methylation domain-containing protein [Erysipelotrichia bacterium]